MAHSSRWTSPHQIMTAVITLLSIAQLAKAPHVFHDVVRLAIENRRKAGSVTWEARFSAACFFRTHVVSGCCQSMSVLYSNGSARLAVPSRCQPALLT